MFKLKKGLIFKKYEFAKLRKSWNGNVWFQIKCKEYEVLHKYKELLLSFAGICDTKLQSFPAFFFKIWDMLTLTDLLYTFLCWNSVETLLKLLLDLFYYFGTWNISSGWSEGTFLCSRIEFFPWLIHTCPGKYYSQMSYGL